MDLELSEQMASYILAQDDQIFKTLNSKLLTEKQSEKDYKDNDEDGDCDEGDVQCSEDLEDYQQLDRLLSEIASGEYIDSEIQGLVFSQVLDQKGINIKTLLSKANSIKQDLLECKEQLKKTLSANATYA